MRPTFAGLGGDFSNKKKSAIHILPVNFDKGSTWMKGADKGPDAIIEASGHLELFDIDTRTEVYEKGIHTLPALNPNTTKDCVQDVKKAVTSILKEKKFPVILGGNHTASIGAMKALSKDRHITILQFDAHADMMDSFKKDRFNHACVMARAKEMGQIVQVGIRSMDKAEWDSIDGNRLFLAKKVLKDDSWMEEAIRLIGEEVYVTIDCDVFDPSLMPSTGTPEPGGLGWYDVMDFLHLVAKSRNVIGFDVTELSPKKVDKAPDFLAAKLIYSFLSQIFIYRD